MDAGHKSKTRSSTARQTPRAAPAPLATRPGLPAHAPARGALAPHAQSPPPSVLGQTARNAAGARRAAADEAPREARQDVTEGGGGASGETESAPETQTPTQVQAAPATDQTSADTSPQTDATSADRSDRRDTPLSARAAHTRDPHRETKLPPLPKVRLPNQAGLRSPTVPKPPASAQKKRTEILKTTGMLPDNHHAAVQRGVDAITAKARMAQNHVVFETGTIAARARSRITNLSHDVDGVVGGGVARIRAAANTAVTQLDQVTNDQIQKVIDKEHTTADNLATVQNDATVRMHNLLMIGARGRLNDVKEAMDTELALLNTQAGQKMAAIKAGTKPTPIPPPEGMTPPIPQTPNPDNLPPSPTTWDQTELEINGQLATSNTELKLTEYANLRCRGALPGLVNTHQMRYDESNDDAVQDLTSDETKVRFFDQTMGLIAPTQLDLEGHTNPTDDASYVGNLNEDMRLAYTGLDADKRAIIRQLDQKRTVLKEQTLNPDYEESQPAKAIDGLRKAGKKIEDGMVHQALMIEATLKANLANLAAEYPGVVARLIPIIETGGFLEAASVLRDLDAAEASINVLQDGQIAQIAEQAEAAYLQSRKGITAQLDSLRKTARKSVETVGETSARIKYSLMATTASYTGDIDLGMLQALPQIIAHAERTAEHLLKPEAAAGGALNNLKNAAINFMNGMINGEWERYTATLNGLSDRLGGIQHTYLGDVDNANLPFGLIRKGVVADSVDRATKVEDALTPAPLTPTKRNVLYGGAAVLSTIVPGAAFGVLGYDYFSDPNETEVVEALTLPFPGPAAVEEAQTNRTPFRGRESLIELITTRMQSEGEQADILSLFSTDPGVTRQAKLSLFAGAESSSGISASAALGLLQSLSAEELSASVMTEAENRRMAQAIQDTLSDPTDREIAAAYMNGEPDQALALRMRRLIDSQRNKEYNTQLRTGQELDTLVRQELFGSQRAYIPPEEMTRMRNAAFLRFDEVTREGHTPVTLNADGPRQGAVDSGALTPSQLRTQGWQTDMSIGRADGAGYDSRIGGVQDAPMMSQAPISSPQDGEMSLPPPPVAPAPNAADPLMPRENTDHHDPQTLEDAADGAATLSAAQDAVLAYMHRPLKQYSARRNDRYAGQRFENFHRHDHRHPQTSYDPETGKVVVSTASALMAYNTALIRHGSGHPETRGAHAAATIARIPANREPSENQINLLNDSFTNGSYNRIRVEWQHASPQKRIAMQADWVKAQQDHQDFLHATARQMGLSERKLADPAAVEEFLTDQLGDRFAQVGSSFRQAGRQIISKGRIDIDTGMRLAAEGWGTNEPLMQSTMANRSDFEWDEERADGHNMRTFAYNIADSELSGDDWQQAREKLRGEDSDDLERADTVEFLIDQQLEDGTGFLASFTMSNSRQRQDLLDQRDRVDNRLLEAAQAGIDDARMRGANIPDDFEIGPVRLPYGALNPVIRRYAMDGDGALRGSGENISAMIGDVRQSADYYRAEIDRQEGFLTSAIMAVAIVASVLAMIIPGINAVVAGIWIALLSGAATVAVKQGMRGDRYGMEEAAVDVGTAMIEAATAGVSGALSKGAQLGTAGRAALAAKDTAKITANATKVAKLGRVGRAGLAMEAKLGPKSAAMVTEVTTNVASGTANAAMNDEMWNDGMGKGLARLAGHGLQSGATAALNVALSGTVSRSLDKHLSPLVGTAQTVGKMNRIGRKLGPQGRELFTEVTAGLAGNLSAEGVNILADLARHPDQMTVSKAFERLGKSGLKELLTTAGKTSIKQMHRARANAISTAGMSPGHSLSDTDMLLLTKLSQSGGLVPPGTTVSEMSRNFSHAKARIAEMPPALHPYLHAMSPDKAMLVVNMMDTGRLGTRTERTGFTNTLGQEIVGLDVGAFDAALVKANVTHAPKRKARNARLKSARRAILNRLPVAARARVGALNLDGLADLSPDATARIAHALAQGAPLEDLVTNALGDGHGIQPHLLAQLGQASAAITDVNAEIAQAKARVDDDLGVATPKAVSQHITSLPAPARRQLHAALTQGDQTGAQRILTQAGLSDAVATRVATSMTRHVKAQNVRRNFMDNIAPEHHQTMGQLTSDMLMEVRVAQFTRTPLSPTRLEAILAEVKTRRPNADVETLRGAIGQTLQTRHGRPGFRTGLAQKRALLDLVPAGMKHKVLRTPVITLDKATFLSFVHGSGSENAVTLIVNGRPVVVMRADADPVKLAEEGLHVLQFQDPEFHHKVTALDERHVARWEELDFDSRINTYGTKVDVEIDGQRRMIARLEKRQKSAWMVSTRTQASKQLKLAQEALDNLTARRKEMRALPSEAIEQMRLGMRPEPDWLAQPARMFSKNTKADKRMRRLLPHPRQPVVHAYQGMLERVGQLTRGEEHRMLNLLRTMKGAVPLNDMVEALYHVNRDNPDPDFKHLSGLAPGDVVDAVQTHIFDTRFSRGANGKDLATRHDGLAAKLRGKKLYTTDAEGRAIFDQLTVQAGDAHELVLAKQAMFLSLEHSVGTSIRNSEIREKLDLVASIFNVGPVQSHMTGLANRPLLQAFALEALATSKTLMTDKNKPRATVGGLVTAIRQLTKNGITDFAPEQQRALFQTIGRAYYARRNDATLMAIAELPEMIRAHVHTDDLHAAGYQMERMLNHLTYKSPSEYRTILTKLKEFMAVAVAYDLDGDSVNFVGDDRITRLELSKYISKVRADDQYHRSFMRIASRFDAPEAGEDLRIRPKDRKSLQKGDLVDLGQDEFMARHDKPLLTYGRGQDTEILREETVITVQKLAVQAPNPVVLSDQEARAIVQRIETVDPSSLFSALTATPQTRDSIMRQFIGILHDARLNDIPATDRSAANKRGELIEATFRKYVREIAGEKPADHDPSIAATPKPFDPLMAQILTDGHITRTVVQDDGSSVPVIQTLSPDARAELLLMMVRGAPADDLKHLPDAVATEIREATHAMVAHYTASLGDDPATADQSKIETSLRAMLGEGLVHVEKSGKGIMLEHMIESLLHLDSGMGAAGQTPTLFDDLVSITTKANTEFTSFDQKADGAKRSFDHGIEVVGTPAHLPAGIQVGDRLGVDAKNGDGAFSRSQFKRYMVEMLNGATGKDGSLFHGPDGADGSATKNLAGMLYVADSPKNVIHAQAQAMSVLSEVLENGVENGRVTFEIDGQSTSFSVAEVIKAATHINVHFGRLSTAGDTQTALTQQLGPFTLEAQDKTISSELIRRLQEITGQK